MKKLILGAALAVHASSGFAFSYYDYVNETPENMELAFQAAKSPISANDFPIADPQELFNVQVTLTKIPHGNMVDTFLRDVDPERRKCWKWIKNRDGKFNTNTSQIARFTKGLIEHARDGRPIRDHWNDAWYAPTMDSLEKAPFVYSASDTITAAALPGKMEVMSQKNISPTEYLISIAKNSRGIYEDLPGPVELTWKRDGEALIGRFIKNGEVAGYKVCPRHRQDTSQVYCETHHYDRTVDLMKRSDSVYSYRSNLMDVFNVVARGNTIEDAKSRIQEQARYELNDNDMFCNEHSATQKEQLRKLKIPSLTCAQRRARNEALIKTALSKIRCSRDLMKLSPKELVDGHEKRAVNDVWRNAF